MQAAWYTLAIAALYNGVAQAARDWLVTYLTERTPTALGASLSTLTRFQEAVGEIDARLLTNQILIESAALRTDNGATPPATESGLIKMTVTTNAIAAVERAVELIGNPGLSRANQLERPLRDVLCSRIHTPQNDSILVSRRPRRVQSAGTKRRASMSVEFIGMIGTQPASEIHPPRGPAIESTTCAVLRKLMSGRTSTEY